MKSIDNHRKKSNKSTKNIKNKDKKVYSLRKRKRSSNLSNSFVSDIDSFLEEESQIKEIKIKVMNICAKLIYSPSQERIEVKGNWSSKDEHKCTQYNKIEYILNKTDKIIYPIHKSFIQASSQYEQQLKKSKKDVILLKISSSNLYGLLIIDDINLLKQILFYLSGKYSGYFLNKDKKGISDDVYLSFLLSEDFENQILITGCGEDGIGKYTLSGLATFNRTKYEMIENNIHEDVNSSIHLGDISFNKYYSSYNS